MRKRLLIKQPGRYGDILICLPIAKWYFDMGYDIDWLCPKEYHELFRNIDYATPIDSQTNDYHFVLDLAFGINKGTSLHYWWMNSRPTWQSFVSAKYFLAGLPIKYRWNLIWKRDLQREELLYKRIKERCLSDYAVVHESTWDFKGSIFTTLPKVLFECIDDFNIFDWYLVLLNSQEIHCIDSSLCNFVDAIPELHSKKKFYYITSKVPSLEDRTILINNWRFR